MFYLAMVTNRVLIIDAPFPIPLTEVFRPAYIQWNASYPDITESFSDLDYGVEWEMREDVVGYRVPRVQGVPRKWALDEMWVSDTMKKYLKNGNWDADNTTFAEVANEAFRAMFRFTSAVKFQANEFMKQASLTYWTSQHQVSVCRDACENW